MILRDGGDGLEVLLGRRRRGRAFGERHVFPGGVVDLDDQRTSALGDGLSEVEARRRLGLGAEALGYWVAAVREAFEETGLLFLRDGVPSFDQLLDLRQQLLAGDASFGQLCSANGLRLDLGSLYYVAHWITPAVRAARFDTRFFMAALPPGQRAAHDGVELTDSVWLTPDDALTGMRAGRLKLAPPTAVELERLSRFPTTTAALTWAESRWREGVPGIMPVVEGSGTAERVRMPPEAAAAHGRATGSDD